LEDDSSDDEDDKYEEHVLRDWQNYDFPQLTINAGGNVPCEYNENEISVGVLYPTSEYLKICIKR
jgi:hypothetical protein